MTRDDTPDGFAAIASIENAQSEWLDRKRVDGSFVDAETTSKTLDVVNVSRSYGAFKALDGVDIDARPGEIVGILGPNGAGKSTLIRACEGLEPIDQGRILILGEDLSVDREAAKGRIGLVLQRPKFSGYATVRETIALFRSFAPAAASPDAMVDALGLAPKLDVRVARLSGGERQRLAVLIGLMGAHDLILLDEPTSELDPQARRVVWQLISWVARQKNSAVLMTTHQMEEAEFLCDRVYIVDHGRIIASGSPAQIIVENCDTMSIVFTIGSDALDELESTYADLRIAHHGLYLKCRKRVATVEQGQDIMRDLLARFGAGVLEVGMQRQNLEDVFIKLTGAQPRA